MLSYQWQDRTFTIDSLNSRRPVNTSDELIVIACPDPPGAEDCLRTVRQVRKGHDAGYPHCHLHHHQQQQQQYRHQRRRCHYQNIVPALSTAAVDPREAQWESVVSS